MKRKNALLSVYEKSGIVEFASELIALGFNIMSSGGTAKHLAAAGVLVEDVAELVGGGPILGHRVVTLSREVHAGLLATNSDADIAELESLGLPRIDLVCNDLYPLKKEIAKLNSTRESVIEKTDIGGPTLLSSSAKGRRITICDPADRQKVLDWLKAGTPDEDSFITCLSAKADFVVADYRLTSAVYHGKGTYAGILGKKISSCKYGENAYQSLAGFYSTDSDDPLALDKFKFIVGDPSYNNFCDIDRLLQIVTHIAATFDVNYSKVPLIAVGVKHGNACGAAIGDDAKDVARKMITGDTLAIFGGFIMLNFTITKEVAEIILYAGIPEGQKRLLDGVVASAFDEETIEMFKRKADKCRLITNPALDNLSRNSLDTSSRLRHIRGGFLTQPNYTFVLDLKNPNLVKYGQANATQEQDMLLAKAICDTSNSNTITIVSNGTLIGNGVGQQARVYGAHLALNRARQSGHGDNIFFASAASDSFFPEVDGIMVLGASNIHAIISSSGSIKDKEVIEYCENNSIALYLIPDKEGRGFFGH
jgi:phosphoribosylaminoimidazolecarboxamide formyltransferase/IMP cyclohydrolase